MACVRRHHPFGSNPVGVSHSDIDTKLRCIKRRSGKAFVKDATQPMYPLAPRFAAELTLHDGDKPQYFAVLHANLGSISMQVMSRLVELQMIWRNQECHGNYPDDCGNDQQDRQNFDHHPSTRDNSKNDQD